MPRANIRRQYACLRCLLLIITALLSAPASGFTQESPEQQSIVLRHTPPAGASIPPVGNVMSLKVELQNTVDITTKIRLVGSKDGRFIDIALPKGALNNSDRATFSIEIPAPVAYMTYQFIVHQPNGSITSTDRYILKRPCIENFKVDIPDNSGTAEFSRQVASLVAKSKELERDTVSLEAAFKLLERMKVSLSK